MAILTPKTIVDAHRLLEEAKELRISAKEWESMGNPNLASYRIWEANYAEESAAKFLALSETPVVGTDGELLAPGDPSRTLVGVVDTVKNPSMATMSASRTRIDLADKAGVYDLASDMAVTIQAENSIEKAMAHQMAAAHAHSMKLFAEADRQQLPVEKVRLTNAAARLMTVFQEGALAIEKLRGGGKQQVTVVHQHVQVAGGQVAVTGTMERKAANDKKMRAQGVKAGGRKKNEDQPHAP